MRFPLTDLQGKRKALTLPEFSTYLQKMREDFVPPSKPTQYCWSFLATAMFHQARWPSRQVSPCFPIDLPACLFCSWQLMHVQAPCRAIKSLHSDFLLALHSASKYLFYSILYYTSGSETCILQQLVMSWCDYCTLNLSAVHCQDAMRDKNTGSLAGTKRFKTGA